jgi:hypothetical protein
MTLPEPAIRKDTAGDINLTAGFDLETVNRPCDSSSTEQ